MPSIPLYMEFFSLVFGDGGDHLGTDLVESKDCVRNQF